MGRTGTTADLTALLSNAQRIVALTGAGVSTESGIPDYRSPEALATPRRPVQGPDFVRSPAVRQRYWARAMIGWARFEAARAGAAHFAMARLERSGVLHWLITQNVDRLHHAAGSRSVTELHGAMAEVVCLDCQTIEERAEVQARMLRDNADWLEELTARSNGIAIAPDGDAAVELARFDEFVVPRCESCGGTLKPNVVFFGHNVAKSIVDEAYARVDAADALLVAGTSLAVFSGYRFLLRAAERGVPIAIVNRGPVRGEERAILKVEESTGKALSTLAESMSAKDQAKALAFRGA